MVRPRRGCPLTHGGVYQILNKEVVGEGNRFVAVYEVVADDGLRRAFPSGMFDLAE